MTQLIYSPDSRTPEKEEHHSMFCLASGTNATQGTIKKRNLLGGEGAACFPTCLLLISIFPEEKQKIEREGDRCIDW